MREYGSNINLPSLDNLFSSEQERQDAKLEKIQILPLTELHPFRNHPFQVRDDDEMDKMVDSVKEYGVMTPAIVRPRKDGGYEIVAGHRRCHASQRAGVETMPCIVRDMDDDTAIILMVDSNTGCAIVIIAHMNKMRDTNPLYRTNGSIDIAGAARSILAITRSPNKEAPAERYMVQVKSNLAPTGSAILFEVAEKGVDFISEMEMTAEEAFQSLAPKMGRPNEKELKAKEFLLEMLKDGEMLSSDCEEKLEAAGFKKSTIKKAKKKAGVISRKQGFLWYWSLPMGDIPRE